VLHYLNDVPPADKPPGFRGETWLPLAHARHPPPTPTPGAKAVPGVDGVLVAPRAGDALVFFSFDSQGDVLAASLHGGRPASSLKWIANQWVRLELATPPTPGSDSAQTPAGARATVKQVAGDAQQLQLELVPRGPGFGPRVIK